jgi:alpha-glucosidase
MSESAKLWWRDGVIYQIYPRSFQDSNNDGVGDLRGILSRLDYLVELGIDAIWISPFYPSPMADFGYDVANYCDVDPLFGTLADFDALIQAIHQRGLKLILDFVPNHTSNQHPWFIESRSSRTNPKRDWYLWRDPAPDGGPPNNWMSHFGGPAWALDSTTGQFYSHAFLAEQADLNWRNPEVREAMYAAMRFWLDRGVDGFRMDVLWLLIKDDQFRDNPPGGEEIYNADQPGTQAIVREMRALLDQYGDRVLIGEIYLPLKALVRYYGEPAQGPVLHLDGAQMPFNFQLILTAWDAEAIAKLICGYEADLPDRAWPNYVLGNHDQKRLASRIGTDQARVAAVLLLTLRGTPTMYYGDELGMPDARISPDQVRDPAEKNQPGRGQGRDPERSPMLWENRENAGFTASGTATWLPLVWDWANFTVETEASDQGTMLKLYRRLLALRRERPELSAGCIEKVRNESGVLSYDRCHAGKRITVMLNMTGEERWMECAPGRILLTSFLDRDHNVVVGWIQLRRHEAVVLEMDI